MKIKSLLIAALIAFCIYADPVSAQASLEGTWQATYLEFSTPDTTFKATGDQASSQVKVINQTHFATINQGKDMESSMFNGGKYDLTNDTYTEHLEYFSAPAQIGKSFTFESKIDGDKWEITGPIVKDGEPAPNWKLKEVYKRID